MYIPAFLRPLAAASTLHSRAEVCNGQAELCDRSYGNVTFLGSHNSYAFSRNPVNLGRNQEVDLPAQLDLGVRLLQASAHMEDDVLRFCHTDCAIFDGGPVVDYLRTVKTFLDENPNEVLTFIFTNQDDVSVKDVWQPLFDESGITPFIFAPETPPVRKDEWPTLGSMIDSGKRLVVFLDRGADPGEVGFVLPQFQMIWETPFSRSDDSFPCAIDRTAGPLSDADHMYMINHSLNVDLFGIIIPDRRNAARTNSVESILAEADGCNELGAGSAPSFVLLDWVNIGEGKKAVDILNGFSDSE